MSNLRQNVSDACQLFRLHRRGRILRGADGSALGRGAGNAVEFHDFRQYVLGDDPRHVDWSVYGRTGDLTVRLFQQEVRPHLDILIDTSRSMAINDGRKHELTLELTRFFEQSARRQSYSSTLHGLGESYQRLDPEQEIRFEANSSLLFFSPRSLAQRLKKGALTLVISDFLSPEDPSSALRFLGAGSSQLMVLMLLGPWESAPDANETQSLIDAETSANLTTNISKRSTKRYLKRLHAIQSQVEDTCRQMGAAFVCIRCDRSLLDVLREDLLPPGLIVPT